MKYLVNKDFLIYLFQPPAQKDPFEIKEILMGSEYIGYIPNTNIYKIEPYPL